MHFPLPKVIAPCLRRPAVRAVTNCTLWEFSGARLATLLKHQPEFLPPLCNSYLQAR